MLFPENHLMINILKFQFQVIVYHARTAGYCRADFMPGWGAKVRFLKKNRHFIFDMVENLGLLSKLFLSSLCTQHQHSLQSCFKRDEAFFENVASEFDYVREKTCRKYRKSLWNRKKFSVLRSLPSSTPAYLLIL